MFCAFSQFLDRHVHWSESSTTGGSRSPFSEIKRRFWETTGLVDSNNTANSGGGLPPRTNNTAAPPSSNNNIAKAGDSVDSNSLGCSDDGSSSSQGTPSNPPSPSLLRGENSFLRGGNGGGGGGGGVEDPIHSPGTSPHRHNRRHLPAPSGAYTVGCVDLMCDVDAHGSFFRLYYPTQKTDIHRHYKQWPLWLPRKEYVHGYMYFLKRSKKFFGRLANYIAGDVYMPVLWQAPLLRSDEKFPVIIVSHGLGGNRTTMSTYSYTLASHGFVVVAIEHRDGSASMTLCLQDGLTSSLRDDDTDSENGDEIVQPLHKNHHHHQHHHPYLRFFPNSEKASNKSNSHEENCDMPNFGSGDSAVQFYLNEGKESRDGHGGRGLRVRQRRENKRRSLRHNHSCSEEWRPFNHIKVWDDFDFRNGQMYHRVDEISNVLDELIHMNEGLDINNALGITFRTSQFKNRLDISKIALMGHSFGGAACLATMAIDERIKAGISLDGWLHPLDDWVDKTCRQPVIFLNMGEFQWERNVNRMIKFQNANTEVDRPMLTLMGAVHQSVTDFQFLVPIIVGRFMELCHSLRPELCMAACVDSSLAFLYKHLDMPMEPKHKEILQGNHPHLITGTNVDLSVPDDGPQPPVRITRSAREDTKRNVWSNSSI